MNIVLAEFKSITTECQQNANDSGTGEEENPCHRREENERSEDERGLCPSSNVMVQEACFHMELLQVGREELIQEWSVSWTWNRG